MESHQGIAPSSRRWTDKNGKAPAICDMGFTVRDLRFGRGRTLAGVAAKPPERGGQAGL